jgi:predicted cupin superfamily sugar epimerase
MLLLKPDGTGEGVILGQDIGSGMRLQHVVPGGTWQGSSLVLGGQYALLGTTMALGFDIQDYEPASRDYLRARYAKYAALISILTR